MLDSVQRASGRHHSVDVVQARAGVIATEFSLLGLGSAMLLVISLAVASLGDAVMPVVRQAATLATGMVVGGVLSLVCSHQLDIGGCRRYSRHMDKLVWPLLLLAGLQLLAMAYCLAVPWPQPGATAWASAPMVCLMASSLLLAVPLLAGVALRALGAPILPAPMPATQLLQSIGQTLLAAAAMFLALCCSTQAVAPTARHAVAAAVCTLAAPVLLGAAWLLRESRRVVRLLLASATRLPGVVRCHRIASAATVAGLMLPSLLILHALVTGRDALIWPACVLMVGSNHAMRFAWTFAGWRSNP